MKPCKDQHNYRIAEVCLTTTETMKYDKKGLNNTKTTVRVTESVVVCLHCGDTKQVTVEVGI